MSNCSRPQRGLDYRKDSTDATDAEKPRSDYRADEPEPTFTPAMSY